MTKNDSNQMFKSINSLLQLLYHIALKRNLGASSKLIIRQ